MEAEDNGGSKDVLVVDDSRIVLAMVSDILEAEGYGVRQAENGRHALEMVAEQRPDLILLDVMMPEMDGYETCAALRRGPEYVPVLMLTAKGDLEDLVQGLEVGADDYISKPFNVEELTVLASGALEKTGLEVENVYLRGELERKYQFSNIIGRSPRMQEVLSLIERVAKTTS